MAESLEAALAKARFSEPGLMTHVAGRLFNQPLAIVPTKLQAILAAIGPRLGLHGVQADVQGVIREDRSREYQVVEGVAVIPVMGTVVKRNASGVLQSSGMVSAEALNETLLAALTDPGVRAILFQIDSYGGEVAGTADVAAKIFQARGTKPMWAIADDCMYSAAYWIGSAADRLILTQNGGVGSIGVIAVHVDVSEANAQQGVVVTTVTAGARKADLSPFTPLSDQGRATLQAECDRVWTLFASAVGQHRNLSPAAVKAFEAACFQGTDAVSAKLADAVGTFDDALLELATVPMGGRQIVSATTETPTTTDPDQEESKPDPDDLEPEEPNDEQRPQRSRSGGGDGMATRPEGEKVIAFAEHQELTASARAEGAAQERLRCTAIREIAQIARLPKEKAQALASTLIEKGASEEDARTAFVEAQASLAEETEILGHTPKTEATPLAVKPMQSREAVFARRRARIHSARGGAAFIQGLETHEEAR